MRFITLILLVCMLFLCTITMFSCDKQNTPFENTVDTGFYITEASPTFSNLSEYEKFISETELPEDFVYYEDIKELGIFSCLVVPSYVPKAYSHYSYALFPSEEYNDFKNIFRLNIGETTCSNEIDSKYPLLTDDDVYEPNLRVIYFEKNGRYMLEGLEYRYRSGKLESIRWQSGGNYYRLEFEENFHRSFDPNDDANIAKLFNAETAIEFISSVAPPDKVE